MNMKRLFDFLFSFAGFLVLLPLMLVIALIVTADSKGKVFYLQERVGRHGKIFRLIKFRTMHEKTDEKKLITIGERDPRITRAGYYLRKMKLDELPQLLNVVKGDMSLVGPRPEVKKYVDLYSPEQKEVLSVRPGITSLTSLRYIRENEILGEAEDPEKVYIREIMPEKLKMDLEYIHDHSFGKDLIILFKTFRTIIKRKGRK